MRCARWGESGIALAERELGELAPGWVRLRVSACGICGSDLHAWRRETPVDPEGVPGHEMSGTLVSPVASGDLEPGALYAVEPKSHCGRCRPCRAGQPQLCAAGALLGVDAPGGLAQAVDVPRACVHRVPGGVSPLLASLAEPLAVALRARERARLGPGARVLVLGGGTIGLLCGLVVRDRAAKVAIVVRHEAQAAAARDLGLVPLWPEQRDAWAESEAPQRIFETVGGEAATLEEAVHCAAPGGRIVVLGLFAGYRPLDARSFVLKELQLVASNMYTSDAGGSQFGQAVAELPRWARELSRLQTHQFPLERAPEAFACAADKRSGAIKVTLLP